MNLNFDNGNFYQLKKDLNEFLKFEKYEFILVYLLIHLDQ